MSKGVYDHYKLRGRKRPPFSEEWRKNLKKAQTGKRYSNKTNQKKARFGEEHPRWKGGEYINSQGYVIIFQAGRGYVKRARLVMERMIGRPLHPEEIVHHKGIKYPLGSIENKQDDRPENLELLFNRSGHMKIHNRLKGVIQSV